MSVEAKKEGKVIDTKKALKTAADKKLKIKFNDKVKIEIITDSAKFFKKGQTCSVHRTMADQYVKDKIAKIVG